MFLDGLLCLSKSDINGVFTVIDTTGFNFLGFVTVVPLYPLLLGCPLIDCLGTFPQIGDTGMGMLSSLCPDVEPLSLISS